MLSSLTASVIQLIQSSPFCCIILNRTHGSSWWLIDAYSHVNVRQSLSDGHTSNGNGIMSIALMFTVAATRSHNRTQTWICTPTDSWHYVQIKSVDVVDYFPTKLHNFRCSYKPHTLHRLFNLKRRATDEITSERGCSLWVLKSVWNIQMRNVVIIELNLIRLLFKKTAPNWESAN